MYDASNSRENNVDVPQYFKEKVRKDPTHLNTRLNNNSGLEKPISVEN